MTFALYKSSFDLNKFNILLKQMFLLIGKEAELH